MRKQFIIPRQDIKIPTRRKSSEEKEVTNSFSNHPTTDESITYDGSEEGVTNSFSNHPTGGNKEKWSRDKLIGKCNPLFRNGGGLDR